MGKKLYYKIGEACKELDIQPYVLRYWETEFQALSPSKSKSGQRVYSAEDLELISRIKELLYKEGYTIAGAKKKLESEISGRPKAVETEPVEAEEESGADADEESEPAQESAEQAAPKAVPKVAKKKSSKATKKRATAGSAEKARILKLQKGIRLALKDVQDILDILDRP